MIIFARFVLTLPTFYFLQEGIRANGGDLLARLLGSVAIVILYDVSEALRTRK